ncbi:MAG TPA: hypothetical protein VMH87_03515 [Pseudomonadales bacterium]|nr:hypothetical protein [Pseudomonadales bacterium]
MKPKPSLDKFGALFVRKLRDRMLDDLEKLLRGESKARNDQKFQSQLSSFTGEQKQAVRDAVDELIKAGMHDLLFAIQEEADSNGSFKILVDGQEVAKLSDGLHGEIFGDEGWIVRFSKHPCPSEIEGSKRAREFIANWMKVRPPGLGEQPESK